MDNKWDVVIVGGGLAGYVAANYLAKAGMSILIIEKDKKVGGRARTDKINQQFFNLGPHAFYTKGNAAPILQELGIELHGKSPKLNGLLIDNRVEYTAPFTPLGVLTTGLFSWKERMDWLNILWKIKSMKIENLSEQTFQQWVQEIAQSKNVQKLLLILGRLSTYCHAPEKVSARVIVAHLKMVLGGVLYIDKGWQTIIDQLHNKSVTSGVQIQTGVRVNEFKMTEKNFRLSLSTEEELTCNYVLSTTGPRELMKMLGDNITQAQLDFFTQVIPVKGASLDVALTQLPKPNRLFAMEVTEPFYYSVHSNAAILSENENTVVLHVFKYLHPDDNINGKLLKNELEQFLEKIQPGWQNYKVSSRFMPTITVNQRLPQIGEDHKLQCSKLAMSGLYLAGDWTSPHSILSEGAIISAKQAAEEIIEKEQRLYCAN
ncbi:Phytoene dehydrogenase-related protein [Psychrobacillus sp. OK028]|uniref:phytoene desaturase family protein n=1 Tax=Psychrobacillus sp. OK028 TaxID=1884359 RepID=UPI000883560C|nr:FAD-dependent oxidoreductase [Psychrobacillus sp. OK028]SDO09149.1 Phytoene dehydrogenase-related protein [Psychrobacillus sp. OK028]